MLEKTSIVVVAYDFNFTLRCISKACLGNIAKWTDREDYELIFVDQAPCTEIESRYHCIDIDKHIKTEDIGGAQAFNVGAKAANPDYKYICFMHNDLFVVDNWLPAMLEPLKNGEFSQTMPHQGIVNRENVKKFQSGEDTQGNDDAGMVCMTQETFKKTGGWDENFPNVYQELAFRKRFLPDTKVITKIIITHISSITLWADEKRRIEEYAKEDKLKI